MSYIKLDRKLLSWEWKDDPNMVALWIEILLEANFTPSKWHGETYEEGSFPTSVDKLAKATGLTVRQTRTCLNKLKSTNEVTIKTTSRGTKISIVKWAEYQGLDGESDKQNDKQIDKRATNERQTSDNTIRRKESKKEKNSVYIGKSEEFIKAFKDFEEMRIKKKKPMTERAKELILKDLDRITKDEQTQIAILEKSTKEGWSGVYALKDEPKAEPKSNYEEMANAWKNY